MKAPDLIVINGKIVPMDPLFPMVEALAARDGKVIALGSTADIRALAAAGTRVVDAGGRLVLPGFHDTHIHLQDGGYEYGVNLDLSSARTTGALTQLLVERAAKTAAPWLRGVGWFTGNFSEANLNRHLLDQALSDRAVYLMSSDGHSGCLNSRGCEALGMFTDLPDLANGRFVTMPDGTPSGMVHETAHEWVRGRLPPPGDAAFAEGVRFGQAMLNGFGITGILEAVVEERHCRIFQSMADGNDLTVRVASTGRVVPEERTKDALARLQEVRHAHRSNPMFKVHSAKFFIDGVLESRTAAMLAPYCDGLGGNGDLIFDPAQLNELFIAFDAARFQIHTHVIGDRATRVALDGLQAASDSNGLWPSLHQLAHVECVDPADIPRFAALGAVANIQPLWACNDASVTEVALPMIGAERGKGMYPFRSLVDAGAGYCLSSDWGVSTPNPFEIMSTAITRQLSRRRGPSEPFLPEQRLTRAECVKGYTTHAAATSWSSATTGALTPGKYADLIILDRDIFTCDVYDIAETEVLLTLLAGAEVHRAPNFSG